MADSLRLPSYKTTFRYSTAALLVTNYLVLERAQWVSAQEHRYADQMFLCSELLETAARFQYINVLR
jgi:hypothetical protein